MDNRGRARTWIIAGVVILLLVIGGIVFFRLGEIFSSAKNTVNDENNALPGQQVTACIPSDLDSLVSFSIGNGSVTANFTITNISNTPCSINGQNYVAANYDTSQFPGVRINDTGQPFAQDFTLTPGSSIYAQMQAPYDPAQCPVNTPSAQVTFTDQISPSNEVTFADSGGTSVFDVPVCSQVIQNEQVSVSNWSNQPQNEPSSFPIYFPGRII